MTPPGGAWQKFLFWGLIINTHLRIAYHADDVPRRRVAEIPILGVSNDTQPFVFPAVPTTSHGRAWKKFPL